VAHGVLKVGMVRSGTQWLAAVRIVFRLNGVNEAYGSINQKIDPHFITMSVADERIGFGLRTCPFYHIIVKMVVFLVF
jgi:hypothetical protein